jgi:hypothetical protein
MSSWTEYGASVCEPEHPMLARPRDRRVEEAGESDPEGQSTFDSGPFEVGREKTGGRKKGTQLASGLVRGIAARTPCIRLWHLRKSLCHEHRLVPLEHPGLMRRIRGIPPIEVTEGQTVGVVNAKAARDDSHAPGPLKTGSFHLEASTNFYGGKIARRRRYPSMR